MMLHSCLKCLKLCSVPGLSKQQDLIFGTAVFTGSMAQILGINTTFIISGSLAIAIGLLAFGSAKLMQLDKN